MHSCCTEMFLLVVIVHSHTLTSMHLHGSSQRSTLSAFRPKTFTLHPRRAMSYTLQNLTTRTSTPSSPFPESAFQQIEQPCEDQRPQQSGALTELPHLTGYGPTRLLKTGITGTSPETVSSLKTRIYVSHPCPSTSRS